MRVFLYFVTSMALIRAASTQQVHVPGDYGTLQAAIDAVPAGATIVVDGGLHPRVIVHKPLTIMGGSQVPFIHSASNTGGVEGFVHEPALTLGGPGSGVVSLQRLRIGGFTDSDVIQTAGDALVGSGFDEVRILDCIVFAPIWLFNGGNAGPPRSVDVDIPFLLVADSQVTGGEGLVGVALPDVNYDGTPAIISTGVVGVFDSIVHGGNGVDLWFDDAFFPGFCPGDCVNVDHPLWGPIAIVDGTGGTAIVAEQVLFAGSVIKGGQGGVMTCSSTGLPVCAKENGIAFGPTTHTVALDNSFQGSGPLVMGQPWIMSWQASSALVLLIISSPTPPIFVPGAGWVWVDLVSPIFELLDGQAGSFALTVPDAPALLGVVIGLHLYDEPTGVSRPVFAAFAEYE